MSSRLVTSIPNRDERCVAQVYLLTLTDCTPYPLAAFSVLRHPGFPDCRYIHDSCSKLLISGPWLGLTWREVLDGNWERLSIWNWKSGNVHLVRDYQILGRTVSDSRGILVHRTCSGVLFHFGQVPAHRTPRPHICLRFIKRVPSIQSARSLHGTCSCVSTCTSRNMSRRWVTP
jgi:hypothetical protein